MFVCLIFLRVLNSNQRAKVGIDWLSINRIRFFFGQSIQSFQQDRYSV
jgi:hypothetical protein